MEAPPVDAEFPVAVPLCNPDELPLKSKVAAAINMEKVRHIVAPSVSPALDQDIGPRQFLPSSRASPPRLMAGFMTQASTSAYSSSMMLGKNDIRIAMWCRIFRCPRGTRNRPAVPPSADRTGAYLGAVRGPRDERRENHNLHRQHPQPAPPSKFAFASIT